LKETVTAFGGMGLLVLSLPLAKMACGALFSTLIHLNPRRTSVNPNP